MEDQPTMVVMAKMPAADIKGWIGDAFSMVAARMGRSGVDFAGPPFARFRPLDDRYSEFEIEARFPVSESARSEGEVVASTLPGGAVAVATHVGPYDQMEPAYEAIRRWIAEQDGRPEGAAWEVYYSDPAEQPDPATWRTEIVQPYKVN